VTCRRSDKKKQPEDRHPGPLKRDVEDLKTIDSRAFSVAKECAELITRQRVYDLNKRGNKKKKRSGEHRPSPTADHHLCSTFNLGDDFSGSKAWHKILSVAIDMAMTDPRYWGVSDPKKQRYCSHCRKVHHPSKFKGDNVKCLKNKGKK